MTCAYLNGIGPYPRITVQWGATYRFAVTGMPRNATSDALRSGIVSPKSSQRALAENLLKTLPVRPQFRYNLSVTFRRSGGTTEFLSFNAFPTRSKLKPKWRNWQTR